MLKFIIRRVLWTIPVILLVVFMTFIMMRQIKGNPFQVTERAVPVSIQRNLDRKYHLDKPWYTQYFYYVKGVFTADLGPSLVQRNQGVNDIIKEHFPVSLKLGALAMLWALAVGIPLGIIAALKQNTPLDYAVMTFVNLGYAIPNFLIATLLIYFFALKWRAYTPFPTNGWTGPASWVLPAIALGHAPMTFFARIVRGSMLETFQQDYIRTAKAKGLRDNTVVYKHALRSALVPVITIFGIEFGTLLAGTIFTERIFNIDGIGLWALQAVNQRDLPVVAATAIFGAAVLIISNIIVDVIYSVLDPRVRLS